MATRQEIPPLTEATNSRADRREQLIEILVFLFLIVPSMILAYFAVQQRAIGFTLVAASTIARDLALVSLIAFFLWRDRQPVSRIGWSLRNAGTDLAIGLVLFVPSLILTSLLNRALQAAGLSGPSAPPTFLTPVGPAQILLAFVLVVIVAFTEETIFRGYLILRFAVVTRSVVWAILLSALVFSLGHGYEGGSGVVTVGVMGVIFALVYVWRRSLVAPATMHFLQDFLAIVLIPLLALLR